MSEVDKELKFSAGPEEEVLCGEAAEETCLVEELEESSSSLAPPTSKIYVAGAEDKSSSEGTEFSKKNTHTQTS